MRTADEWRECVELAEDASSLFDIARKLCDEVERLSGGFVELSTDCGNCGNHVEARVQMCSHEADIERERMRCAAECRKVEAELLAMRRGMLAEGAEECAERILAMGAK